MNMSGHSEHRQLPGLREAMMFYSLNHRSLARFSLRRCVSRDGARPVVAEIVYKVTIMPNRLHATDADATQLDSCVASAVCIGLRKRFAFTSDISVGEL